MAALIRILRTLFALAIAAGTVLVACYALFPAGFPSIPALLAGAVLIFPLHALVVTGSRPPC